MTAAILAAVALLPAAAWQAADPAIWTEPQEPFEIAGGLYYVGSAGLGAFLLTSDEGHILIDVPMEQNVGLVADNIRALGFDPADVRIQLVSHAHYDHVGGVAAMQRVTGADLPVSAPDAEILANGGVGAPGDLPTFAAVRPNRTVEHLETVGIGSVAITAHVTPGHTPGCTSWGGALRIDGAPITWLSVCSLSVLGKQPTARR